MPTPLRTGYENIIAHRVDERFAYVSKGKGVIKDKGTRYIIVSYLDEKLDDETVEIGLKIATSKGHYYRHDLVCDLPVGYKFEKGEVLVYNTAFFVRDILNLKQVILCDRTFARTMLLESNDTFEDSSAISAEFAKHLSSTSVHERLVVVNASDQLTDMIKVGDKVDVDSTLMYIEDETFQGDTHFDNISTDILRKLSRVSPKAQVKGKVIKIDVFYFCDEDELSSSIKSIVDTAIKERFAGTKTKIANKRMYSGKISDPIRVGKQDIGPGQVAIQIYIEHELEMDAGDKGVFCNQLKTVLGRTYSARHESESGLPIHAMFGYSSIYDRIVASPELMGTTYALLKLATKQALEAYDNA